MLPKDRQHAKKIIHNSLQSHSPFKLKFHITIKNNIHHIHTLTNQILNKKNKIKHLLNININITKIKQLNKTLFQKKKHLHITLNSINKTIIYINITIKITFINPITKKINN